MTTFSPIRAGCLFAGVTATFAGLVGRVAYLQTIGREQTIRQADRKQHQTEPLAARRGCVYDRNGILMAGTVQTRTVYADPKFIQDGLQADGADLVKFDQAVAALAKLVGRKPGDLSKLLSDQSNARYLKLATGVDEATADAVLRLDLPGVGVTPTAQRYYPLGTAGAHLLGGVGQDNRGLEGAELRFETELAGTDGFQRVLKDARRRPVGVAADDYVAPRNGRHLVLTVDANVQSIAEEELAATCERYHAKCGEVVVMDPRTGDVLALANWPTYDPNHLDTAPPDSRRDRALTDPYEPGSTIKPFIVGPAFQWDVTRPDEVFDLHHGHYDAPDHRHVTDTHNLDRGTVWDVLVLSSNIGMCQIGERLHNDRLHTALAAWGFGRPTGIDLPGESGGRLNALAKWTHFSTESVSQGYELMVTPLQLCRGFCAYANGGLLVTPRLVRGTVEPDGSVACRPTPVPVPLLTSEVAGQIRRILTDVPIRGTAANSGTRSLTWNIFGKTGTAHISLGKAGYSDSKYNSSFIAAAPAEDPRLAIAFVVHEPDKAMAHYGGKVAGPGAGRVLERSLAYLQVPPSPDLPLPPERVRGLLIDFKEKAYSRDPKDQARVAE